MAAMKRAASRNFERLRVLVLGYLVRGPIGVCGRSLDLEEDDNGCFSSRSHDIGGYSGNCAASTSENIRGGKTVITVHFYLS